MACNIENVHGSGLGTRLVISRVEVAILELGWNQKGICILYRMELRLKEVALTSHHTRPRDEPLQIMPSITQNRRPALTIVKQKKMGGAHIYCRIPAGWLESSPTMLLVSLLLCGLLLLVCGVYK